MDSNTINILSLIAIALCMAMFWYDIKSIGIMGKRSIWLGILAFLFVPLAQIVFYFSQKNSLTLDERKTMKRFFWVFLAYFILVICVTIFKFTLRDN